jgi:hypothetical protein
MFEIPLPMQANLRFYPENGVNYHIVNFILKDETKIEKVLVYNCKFISDNLDFSKIDTIELYDEKA